MAREFRIGKKDFRYIQRRIMDELQKLKAEAATKPVTSLEIERTKTSIEDLLTHWGPK